MTPDHSVESSRFSRKVGWVQIGVGEEDHDTTPEERLRIAIARQ